MLFMTFPMHLNLPVSLPDLSRELDFGDVPPELSYILIDAMRTVYGEDFYLNDNPMHPCMPLLQSLTGAIALPEGSDRWRTARNTIMKIL